jgi:c-di-GMP-binding flagellar brake protein YcgR
MSTESRAHTRYTVEVAAEVTVGGRTYAAATQNISEGGVGLALESPLKNGTTVDIALFLTQDGIEDPDEEPFEAKAMVAWSTPSESGAHIAGVRFGVVSPTQKALLTRFLAALDR